MQRTFDKVLSPTGWHVYVAGSDDNAVAVFSRDVMTGTLTFVEVQQDGVGGVDGLNGAASVTVSPDGAYVYVAGPLDDTVAMFGRNTPTSVLALIEAQQDGVGDVDGLDGAVSVAVSPDGVHLYAAGQDDNAVAVFSAGGVPCILTGDVNGDRSVDLLDVGEVAGDWRATDAASLARYDFNGNDIVDIGDIMTVVIHWGETCP